MALSMEVMDKLTYSYTIYRSELQGFVGELTDSEEDKFWKWFKQEAEQYEVSTSHIGQSNKKAIPGNCYHNAQIKVIETGLEYCEGMYETDMGSNLLLHGFNLDGDKVVDFTVLHNLKKGKYHKAPRPTVYYGIVIPTEFVRQNYSEEHDTDHNPILSKYFKQAVLPTL
jgi:hypothetical protein